MAFVYRADRDINLTTIETTTAGPGQYTQDIILKTEPETSIPFNTSCIRETSYLSTGPGPAAYDTSRNILKKSFGINSTSPEYKTFDTYTSEPKENLFISSEPRFKNENSRYSIPGPGTYNLIIDRSFSNGSNKNLIPKNNLSFENFSPMRISSIPSKGNCYGFNVNKNGVLVLQDDPKFNEKYTGEKNNSVGPDRYNVISKKKITGNVTFNKAIGHNLDKDLIKNNNISDFEKGLSDRKKDIIIGMNKEKLKRMKLYKNNNISLKNNDHKEDIDLTSTTFIKKDIPGPGAYYSEYGNAIIKPKEKDIKFQNFGSSLSRSLNSIPRDYKNDILQNINMYPSLDEKKNSNIKNYEYEIQIRPNSNIEKKEEESKILNKLKNEKKKLNSFLGPGSYNPNYKFKKPTTNIQQFNIKQDRFPKNEYDNKVPGAGAYLSQLNWVPPHKEFNKEKFQEEMIIIELNRKKKKNKNLSGPSPAEYFPERAVCIKTDVMKDLNKNRPPFNFCDKRFKYDDKNNLIGPGSYNLRKDFQGKEGKVPFSVGEKRIDDMFVKVDGASPASYDRDSVFDWNKKSFNVLFV